jgi:hypothetical protein
VSIVTVIGGPFIWETFDQRGHRIVLTTSSWDRHKDLPGHLTESQWRWIIETAAISFWDTSDQTMKYMRYAIVGSTIKIFLVVVNTQTTPWTARTGFLMSQLSRRYQPSH